MTALNTLWITGYLYFSSLLSRFGFSWNMIGLLCWIIPAIFIGFISMILLYQYFWDSNKKYAFISGLIYSGNTYFLMILSGGQLGVALSYGLVPLVVYRFLKNARTPNLYNSLFFGLAIGLQILFDPRITAVTFIILVAFLFLNKLKSFLSSWKFTILIPIVVVGFLHGYWVIPLLVFYLGKPIAPSIYSPNINFSFFSFATLENSLSILHPNWPENIFGKVHFMRPEFIVLPLIAYISLLNTKYKKTKNIVIVVLVALVASFLAKGVNEPFGIIYELLLKHLPGFAAYRDPTKFYIPIVLCYSLLIPFSLAFVSSVIVNKFKLGKVRNVKVFVLILFILFWVVLISPLFTGKVGGIFKLRTVSSDYYNLKNFITQQPEFYRTLWIPQIQRYGYFTNNHPAIGRGEIFQRQTTIGMLQEFKKPEMEARLSALSVKYVIVPDDSEGEIFVKDNKYDKKQYDTVVAALGKIPYLVKEREFGSIIIYKTLKREDHFSFAKELFNGRIRVLSSKATEYELSLVAMKGDILVFSESFDRNWILKSPSETVSSKEYKGLNSFVISQDGNYNVYIRYKPQQWVNVLSIFSLLTVFALTIYLVSNSLKNKK